MVLAELGGKLRDSLRKFQQSSNVDGTQLNTLLSEIARALIESDVNVKLVMKMRENVKAKVSSVLEEKRDNNQNVARMVQNSVMEELTALLTPSKKKPYNMKRGKSNIVLFVGLQGAGKTTTIAKFANYYVKRGWKTSMVCADTFRAGAFDQLKQNATKLRVPFYGSYTEADPVVIADDGVRQFVKGGYEVIIVDTSGRHQQEASLLEEMQEIAGTIRPHNTVFVVDATQGQAVYDQALAFSQAVDVGSVIVTKLDGHAKGGGALSAVSATQSPILFLGSGEHFEDLETFHAQSFVSKLLGYGDMKGFMEEMKSLQGDKTPEQMMEKFSKGQFTLKDMYSQFSKVLNMGSLNKLMGMVPGMPEYLVPKNGDQEATRRLRLYLYMMDSMTEAELDGRVQWHATTKKPADPSVDSRVRRIARGSGTHPKEVQLLLQTYQQMSNFALQMGKSAGGAGNMEARQKQMAAQMRKNPNLIQQRINQMDPRLLQQMGGAQNVMNMMQSMAKGGGQEEAMQAMMQNAMGGGGIPGMGGGFPGMGGGGGGFPGMPPGMDMNAMAQMMQQMGGGGIPNMPNMRR